jgi:hypothetical protein
MHLLGQSKCHCSHGSLIKLNLLTWKVKLGDMRLLVVLITEKKPARGAGASVLPAIILIEKAIEEVETNEEYLCPDLE